MTVWLASRHLGAIAWVRRAGIQIDREVAHLDPTLVCAGDTVIGTLPMHVAAEVCMRGARFFALDLHLTADMRGRELSEEELQGFQCTLTEYRVEAVFPGLGERDVV